MKFETCVLFKDIDPKQQNNMEIPFARTDYVHHVGSSWDSIFIARQTFFFTAVDPMTETREIPLFEVDEPRMVPYKTNGKRLEDAVLFSHSQFYRPAGRKLRATVYHSAENDYRCKS